MSTWCDSGLVTARAGHNVIVSVTERTATSNGRVVDRSLKPYVLYREVLTCIFTFLAVKYTPFIDKCHADKTGQQYPIPFSFAVHY